MTDDVTAEQIEKGARALCLADLVYPDAEAYPGIPYTTRGGFIVPSQEPLKAWQLYAKDARIVLEAVRDVSGG